MKDGELIYGEEYEGRWSDQADIFGYKVSETYAFGQVFYETEYTVENIAKFWYTAVSKLWKQTGIKKI